MVGVSVIIPFYNRRQTILRALQSVCNQSVEALEIIAVDDASNDGGGERVQREFPEVRLLSHAGNKGVSAARNLGISHAKGEWLAFLDSDDEWLPSKLAMQLARAETDSQYRIIHTDEIWIRNGVRVNPMKKHRKYGGEIFEHCLPLCAISPSAVMIHREIFDQVGLFDESLPACEDYELWLRICSKYPVAYIDQPLVKKYGGHADQLSRQHWGMDRFRIYALDKILQQGNLSELQHQAAVDTLLEKTRILLLGAVKRNNEQMIAHCEGMLEKYQE